MSYDFLPLQFTEYSAENMVRRSREFYENVQKRRTVRHFSERKIPREVIENCLLAAGTAPNGANLQPWHFVVVEDTKIKREIRLAAETEEREFYENRAPDDWLEALAPLGTDANKPFLETAPYLIAIFAQSYGLDENGNKKKHYYVQESVGIATGILITAIHNAGLVSLTHTPSPMNFLNKILQRPTNERPYLILVVGYPQQDTQVPDIQKKSLAATTTFM
ncbi:nitroreductase family protein [Candidatus Uabimicrobium amorphum]|uniref:Oxidoreductase n=1 Tax=Uabimicrobium amorphum TaxID=2596890 RepID=A0A5S9IUD8_UABAM|nr:nitroreductase family protein [Candidatus Uabimicrobium amorphum]BBM87806.1 oxidoreductase [Candidatus Uabimicrobium amorphum]